MLVPKDVEAAISLALDALSSEDIKLLIDSDENELIRLSPWLGAKIRNHLGLWTKDAENLLATLAATKPDYFGVIEWGPGDYSIDADGASGILLYLLKQKLTESY